MLELDTNTSRIRRVDKPHEEPILVALQRLRRCPEEIPNEFWPPDKSRKSRSSPEKSQQLRPSPEKSQNDCPSVPGESQPEKTHEPREKPVSGKVQGNETQERRPVADYRRRPDPSGGKKWAGLLRNRQ